MAVDALRRAELLQKAAFSRSFPRSVPRWRARLRAGGRIGLFRMVVKVRGHLCGPYWFAAWWENGRSRRSYVGKTLPPELAELRRAQRAALGL